LLSYRSGLLSGTPELGQWQTIVSDNGSQFRSHAFSRANIGLGINQHFCEKGRP
jgi:transposase InsO family protein